MNDTPAHTGYRLKPATAADFEALFGLRLRAMRESLERIGRYDEARARERLAAEFDPAQTWHILVDGGVHSASVGFIALKRGPLVWRLDHFYIDPAHQRQGIGARVLGGICHEADRAQVSLHLVALKGSDANRFYRRHGFVANGEGEWDIDYVRMPLVPSVGAVRAFWGALQARDWIAARRLLRADLQATWWTSGERFTSADAFIDVQARYPEGWTIHLLEAVRLEDGRVLSIVRVDQPPASFFCTAIAVVDDGVIWSLDEYWATAAAPPAWRDAAAFPAITRFDPRDDVRAHVA